MILQIPYLSGGGVGEGTRSAYYASAGIKVISLANYAARENDVLSIIVCDQSLTRLTTWLDMLTLDNCYRCQIQYDPKELLQIYQKSSRKQPSERVCVLDFVFRALFTFQ